MSESGNQQLTSRRGGARNSALHIFQLIVSTLLLIIAAVFLITNHPVPGVIAMLIGGIVSFLKFK